MLVGSWIMPKAKATVPKPIAVGGGDGPKDQADDDDDEEEEDVPRKKKGKKKEKHAYAPSPARSRVRVGDGDDTSPTNKSTKHGILYRLTHRSAPKMAQHGSTDSRKVQAAWRRSAKVAAIAAPLIPSRLEHDQFGTFDAKLLHDQIEAATYIEAHWRGRLKRRKEEALRNGHASVREGDLEIDAAGRCPQCGQFFALNLLGPHVRDHCKGVPQRSPRMPEPAKARFVPPKKSPYEMNQGPRPSNVREEPNKRTRGRPSSQGSP